MITYKLTFNSKSKSHKISEAIKIAKDNYPKTYMDTGDNISISTSNCNRSFGKILRIVKNIKGTSLEIDGESVIEIDKILSIIECGYRSKCNGICTIINDYEFQLEMLGVTPKDHNALYNSGRWAFFHYDDAIEQSSSHYLVLKRDVYLKHYLQDTSLPSKICNKYNCAQILEAFNALPNLIRIDFDDDNYSIIDNLMKADNGRESDHPEGEMVVDISQKSIEALGKEIAKRLSELNALNNK